MSLIRHGETCMVNTCNDYRRSGQKLLSRLERSRAPTMIGDHHEEDEEDPRVRLDWLEQSLTTFTSMVAQLLAENAIESTSESKSSSEDPKKEERDPECKT